MTPERFARLTGVLDRRQPTLAVLMESVHKPHNYSAVLRSCEAVGVPEIHAISETGLVQTKPLTSASASKWVDVQIHDDLEEAWVALKSHGFRLLAAHQSERSVDFRSIDYTQPTAILLGAEKEGVTEEAVRRADTQIAIPMYGMIRSLNVSVAAAIILFEAARQREQAGMYDTPQISPADRERLLFEWGYPTLAEKFRLASLPYPSLDENGDIEGDVPFR